MQDLESNRHTCQACQAPDQRIFRQPTAPETHLCFRCYEQQVNTDETIYACASCGNGFSLQELTRDTDDELYCKPCYDAYYEEQDDDVSEDENEEKEEAADPGMLCAACLDADWTVRDLNELLYCQPCFVRNNQPRELPTTRTSQRPPATEAKKQSSGIAQSSSSASSNGAKRFYDQAPATLATNRRPQMKKSQEYAVPIPTTDSPAPRTLASCFASPTSKTPSKENGRSRSSASSSAASTSATPKATAAPLHLSSRAAPSTPTQEESKSITPITPNAATPSSPSSSPAEPLTRANRATSDATTAAGPDMRCTECLNTNATVRDWTGSFYCQPCFDRKNQTPIDFVADVVEPDELPATKPADRPRATAAKKKNSGPAKPSPTAKHGPKRLVDDQAASMSLRGLSIPRLAFSAPQTLASYFAPSTPETPSEEKSASPSSASSSGSPTPDSPKATTVPLPSSSPAAPSTPTQEEESESITPITLDTANSTQENAPPHVASSAPPLSPATPEVNIEPAQVPSAALPAASFTPDSQEAPSEARSDGFGCTSITLDELAELLEHVCSCHASNPCIKCGRARRALHHSCEAESTKSCHECRTIVGLLVAHAKSCGRPRDDCQVPHFKDVRKRVRGISELAHQREMHLATQVGHILRR
ncbi:hypothetical protein Ae201684_009765 [Aphanomyces euteiches]|nr:hypothetical protein Ae201684_009765 [Aphanomyces euteiches]